MRVTVIGAGIVGVCTAWSLAEAGCEVTVIERNRGVAQETSYGNAGMVAPAYVTPWAAPGMPTKILSMLFATDTPVRFQPNLDPALWRWVIRWLGECRAVRFKRNKERMQRLAFYSRDVLASIRTGNGMQYERTEGLLQLLRGPRDIAMAQNTIAFLKEAGVAHRLLTPAECRAVEPGLSEIEFGGGLHLPDGETGNCPLFARHLKNLCEQRGVHFEFGSSITRVATSGDRVTLQLRTQRGDDERSPDAVVIAAGISSTALLRQLGIRLPLYPVKGYSASVAIREPTYAPLASVMDEGYKVAIVRMGNRIRIAGTAELGDRTLSLESRNAERAFATLLKVVRDWFPGAANYQEASWWVGARPMLPDGPPVIGPTLHPRIFTNLGHGSTGWAMAAGSGRIVADLVTGREPAIDLDGLTLARYG
ncbi:MAG: D-amino acid dehydrogenase [Burkholderiaceae bacterium]